MAIQHILVPTDFSEESREAFRYACFLAENTGATVDVIHIWDQPRYLDAQTLLYAPEGNSSQSVTDFIKLEAEEEMKKFLAHLHKNKAVKVREFCVLGIPEEQIIQKAKDKFSDLIVMGTRGRSGISHALLGSVAEKVLRMAPCPVITVRSEFQDPRPKYHHKDLIPMT